MPKGTKIMTKKPKYPAVDEAVYQWVCSVRKLNGNSRPLPVSRALIKARALHEAKSLNIPNFKASDGWFWRWRWRFNVGNSVRLCGEAGDVNLEEATKEIDKLKQSILAEGYEMCNIFNMDETGLFYRAIPSRTYLLDGESKKNARGTKQMKAKDRLTVILCVNATGTCKISPTVIGTAKRPRCFVRNPPELPYFNQTSAWNDKETFQKWWHQIFLKEVREWTTSPVALLMDGFSGHDRECSDPLGQVKLFCFPPNITSVFQPLDQGIIAAVKTRYKSRLLENLVSAADSYQQLQILAEQLPAGCAGLQYANSPHVSDAMALIKHSWDNLQPATIAACWRHANCLPSFFTATNGNGDEDHNSMDKLEEETLLQMNSLLSQLSTTHPSTVLMLNIIGLDVVTSKAVQGLHSDVSRMLTAWLHLEERGAVDNSAPDPDDEIGSSPEVPVQAFEKVSVLQVMLPHLHSIHAAGVKLNDSLVTSSARELCNYVVQLSAGSH